jgi:hypothetical protein
MAIAAGQEMNQTRSHWLVAGSIALVAVASAIMAMSSLNGFSNPASGDLPVSSMNGVSLVILAAGMLIILALESTHQKRRRARHAGMARAGDLLVVGPASTGG